MIDWLTYDLVDHLEKLISQDGETERTRVYLAGVIILGSDSCSSVDHSLAQLLWEPGATEMYPTGYVTKKSCHQRQATCYRESAAVRRRSFSLEVIRRR